MLKKILLSFLLANFLFVSVFSTSVQAQAPTQTTTWYQQTFFDWYDKVYDVQNQDEIFGERYTAAQVEWVLFGTFAFIINRIGSRNLNWCVIHLWQTGLSGSIGSFFQNLATNCPEAVTDLNALFLWAGAGVGVFGADTTPLPYASTIPVEKPQPPPSAFNMFPAQGISFVGYIKDIGSKLKIIPETQAQGFGATRALTGIDNLWRFVRDITYFVLIIAIVVLAFMIMFRVKMSPQSVVTLQSAIPKVIVTLLLITFSYAIAGFMIDIMYVVLGLLAALFTGSNGISDWTWARMFQALAVDNTLGVLFIYVILFFVGIMYQFIAYFGLIAGAGAGTTLGGGGGLIGGFLAILAAIVLLIVMFILSIRIVWMMIRNFVEILLLVAFSPIMIVGGVVGVLGFGAWAKQMAARLAVYPVVAVLLVFSFYFLATAFGGSVGGEDWFLSRMPFYPRSTALISGGNSWDPPLTLGSGAIELLFIFVSVVTITLIPRASEIVKGAFSGRQFPIGTAIGEAVGVASGFARWGGRQAEGQTLGRLAQGWGQGTAVENRSAAQRFVVRTAERRGHARTSSVPSGEVRRT